MVGWWTQRERKETRGDDGVLESVMRRRRMSAEQGSQRMRGRAERRERETGEGGRTPDER